MDEGPTAAALTGTYRGLEVGGVHSFRGIRYGLPPVGDAAFRCPIPVPPSQAVIDASAFAPAAPQPGLAEIAPDCLALNIWCPRQPLRRAVLVVVHGGSFVRGSGADPVYDGTTLAREHGLVVVTINYRLGALGFLNFADFDSSFETNVGLHDLVLALRWIRSNIAAFGGDPQRITVMGHSAGGTLVSALPVLQDTAGLFSRLVIASGIPTAFVERRTAAWAAERFLRFHKIRRPQELRQLSAAVIARTTPAFVRFCGLGVGTYRPCVDGRYLAATPTVLLHRKEAALVPLLIGNTRDELSMLKIPMLRRRWGLQPIIDQGVARETAAVRGAVRALYASQYGRSAATKLLSDMIFRTASLFYAELAAAHSPVWLYRFDYSPLWFRRIGFGAVHSMDLPLFFGTWERGLRALLYGRRANRAAAQQIAAEAQRDLAHFARLGELPWPQGFRQQFIAKCYDKTAALAEPMPRDLYQKFKETRYFRRIRDGSE